MGASIHAYLTRLRAEGLASLPGTAAEILDDEVRRIICPDKITTGQWLELHAATHGAGLRSNLTMMYGHVERPVHWARHLVRAREQQRSSGGFTEFVPRSAAAPTGSSRNDHLDAALVGVGGRLVGARSGP